MIPILIPLKSKVYLVESCFTFHVCTMPFELGFEKWFVFILVITTGYVGLLAYSSCECFTLGRSREWLY